MVGARIARFNESASRVVIGIAPGGGQARNASIGRRRDAFQAG